MADLSTFEFFQKESSHEDVEVRQEAFEQISLICGLIGADQCREVKKNKKFHKDSTILIGLIVCK